MSRRRAMRTYDDDDDDVEESWRGGPEREDDSPDAEPDGPDVTELGGNVRCVHCGRAIHEDADICPRCHRWQTDDDHPAAKPRWFVWTVIVCVAVIALFWVGLYYLDWFKR